jgi:hypothetical protein
MKLSYLEVVDLERFLGTLDTCDYMGIAPKLNENDAFLLAMMQGHMQRWLREHADEV